MALNDVVSADRLHIGFFGMRNAGKSSVVNAVCGQELSVVSDVKGTTTDPVTKAMELAPLGPVVIIDTPGLDDEGELGEKRIGKARRVLAYVDVAVLVVDASVGLSEGDRQIIEAVGKKNIPLITAYNKSDLISVIPESEPSTIFVSAKSGAGINELKDMIAASVPKKEDGYIASDLVDTGDVVILVTPIDKAAPKGRLILPQQKTIRDLLDKGAIPVVTRDSELSLTLERLAVKPRLVITDSQVFGKVARILPRDIPLTSFSILFARYKGTLYRAVEGAMAIDALKDGDKILISEGCTHHRQCGDIGTQLLPKKIGEHTGKQLVFEFTSGRDFPEDVSEYSVIVHCGGCMLTEREVQYRASLAADLDVPFTNYGMVLAHTNGVLQRSLEPLSVTFTETKSDE